MLFTLSYSIWAVHGILIKDFGMSATKANMAILRAMFAENQLSTIYRIMIRSCEYDQYKNGQWNFSKLSGEDILAKFKGFTAK